MIPAPDLSHLAIVATPCKRAAAPASTTPRRARCARDRLYFARSEDELRTEAAVWLPGMYQPGEAGYCDPALARWRYEPMLPLALLGGMGLWREFLREEIAMWAEEGQPHRFADMIHHSIREPVVVLVREGQGYVWDGCHRVGACALSGRTSVPAIVGVPETDATALPPTLATPAPAHEVGQVAGTHPPPTPSADWLAGLRPRR